MQPALISPQDSPQPIVADKALRYFFTGNPYPLKEYWCAIELNYTGLLPSLIFRGRDSMATINNPILSAEDPLIDMTFITTYTGMTDKWFYKLIQDGEFPKPIKLGRSSRWFKSEVESWMQQRIEDSRGNCLR